MACEGQLCWTATGGLEGNMLTPMSSTIILSRPLGPKELLTTFAIAWVARTTSKSARVGSHDWSCLAYRSGRGCRSLRSSGRRGTGSRSGAARTCTPLLWSSGGVFRRRVGSRREAALRRRSGAEFQRPAVSWDRSLHKLACVAPVALQTAPRYFFAGSSDCSSSGDVSPVAMGPNCGAGQ